MKPSKNILRAGRAFLRIMSPIWNEISLAAEADHGFDYGEFSARHHDNRRQTEEERVALLVARGFGISPSMVYAAGMNIACGAFAPDNIYYRPE